LHAASETAATARISAACHFIISPYYFLTGLIELGSSTIM
jgi:hypothetical protein